MTPVERYRLDPGSAYSMTRAQLEGLVAEVGEEEPIIDALMVLDGASREARAEAIGVSVDDFPED